jgi:hypothetical protein
MLTPTEWFEQHQQRHQEKVDKIKQDSFRAKHKEWDRLRRKLTEGESDKGLTENRMTHTCLLTIMYM